LLDKAERSCIVSRALQFKVRIEPRFVVAPAHTAV